MQAESTASEHPVKAKHSASPAVTGTPDFLRRVAEEVRAAFPRPMRTPQLVLIDVDPRHLHAFWSLGADEVAQARQELGSEGESAPMVLRIAQLDPEDSSAAAFDVEVVGLQGRSYVEIWGEARGYSGTLGLRRAGDSLRPLAGPTTIRLPNLGPADQRPAPEPAAGADMTLAAAAVAATTVPDNASERATPISPFPRPPSGPGAADAPAAPGESLEEKRPEPPDAPGNAPLPAAASIESAPTAPFEPAETVRHPFPLPPTEPDEYVPEALVGGFLPEDTAAGESQSGENQAEANQAPVAETGMEAETGMDAEPEGEAGAPHVADGEPASASQPQALPLENVLTLSSYALGREIVDFEINAELHVFGRVRPGTRLQLFGRPVALRPDGSFSITRPLPNGALIVSSLLVEGDGEMPE